MLARAIKSFEEQLESVSIVLSLQEEAKASHGAA